MHLKFNVKYTIHNDMLVLHTHTPHILFSNIYYMLFVAI